MKEKCFMRKNRKNVGENKQKKIVRIKKRKKLWAENRRKKSQKGGDKIKQNEMKKY